MLSNDQFRVDERRMRLPRLGRVRMREARHFAGHIVSAPVSCRAGYCYASITADCPAPLPRAENQ